MRNRTVLIIIILLLPYLVFAGGQGERFERIRFALDSLALIDARYEEPIDVSVTNFSVGDMLRTIAISNKLNVNIALDGHRHFITCNIDQVPIKDVLLLCCRNCDLDLTIDNGIVTICTWRKPDKEPQIVVKRDSAGLYRMDFSGCTIDDLVRCLVKETGSNVSHAPILSGKKVSGLGVGMTLDQMMESIAVSNGLKTERTDSGIWMFGERGAKENTRLINGNARVNSSMYCVRLFPMQYRTVDNIVEFIPAELKKDMEIKVFSELNSLVLGGDKQKIESLEEYLRSIDKSIPLISIDVIIVDASDSKSRSTGISFGKGTNTSEGSFGSVLPGVDVSLGASKINSILGAFNELGLVNLGQVGPNFYAELKLLEEDGIVTLRSTPKLSTLNGHKAVLKSGEVKYYKESQVNIIGTQNPLQSESYLWRNVEANFVLDMLPIVSADSTITIRIELNQDEFTERDVEDLTAPPGITKRSFNSIVKVKNGEMILLGGIERKLTEDNSRGLPWFARVPLLRLFCGNVTRTHKVQKLNVFIRPMIVL